MSVFASVIFTYSSKPISQTQIFRYGQTKKYIYIHKISVKKKLQYYTVEKISHLEFD